MTTKPNRLLSNDEAACVRAALERAPVVPEAVALIHGIPELRVVSSCDCGCASIDFEQVSSDQRQPIADGTGKTTHGGKIGIIVWGTSISITGIEVYDLGAGDNDLGLPELNSIVSWQNSLA